MSHDRYGQCVVCGDLIANPDAANPGLCRRHRRASKAPQLDLALWPPQTHTGDPVTSHEAEARGHANGSFSLQQAAVLDFVTRRPGLMGSEITAAIDVGDVFDPRDLARLQQVRKRLSWLRKRERVDRVTTPGEREVRWYLWNQKPGPGGPHRGEVGTYGQRPA
jgi:hypothetical protein